MAQINTDALSRVLAFGHNMDRDNDSPDIEKIAGMFPRGFMSIFAAQAGTGKTWFMQYLSCRLSCGGNILAGLVARSKKHKTVIMAGETGKFLLDKRLAKTCWAYDSARIRVYDAVELQREDIPVMLNTEEGRMTFIAILEAEKPDIVFFDTLISFHSADESKQGEMTSIYAYLLKLSKAFNCAIVLNHHTRKRSTNQGIKSRLTQDDVIGSSSAVRLASCVYVAEQIHDDVTEDEGMPTVVVHNVKSWDKRIPDFSYKFITDEASSLLDFAIEWGATAEGLEWSIRERVGMLLKSYEAGAIITAEQIASELVAEKDTVRKYLNSYVSKNALERITLPTGDKAWKVKA